MAANEMDQLADRFADRGVTSVFVYTREAHPAENYRHHRSMADKRANAKAFVDHSKVSRRIWIDDLDGTCHRAFGMLPNMTWIVGRGGKVLYKAAWTSAFDVEDALSQALEYLPRRGRDKLVGFYSERMAWRVRDEEAFKAGLERSGRQAVEDFYGKG